MNKLQQQLIQAKRSKLRLNLLNWGLWKVVPFNKPHRLKITEIKEDAISIKAPFFKNNKNHINGIHACLLATMCEYASGLSLLRFLDPTAYRIILKNIQIVYHYQAKMEIITSFTLSQQWVEENIIKKINSQESIEPTLEVNIYDIDHHHICTGYIQWHIKSWNKVKTKI